MCLRASRLVSERGSKFTKLAVIFGEGTERSSLDVHVRTLLLPDSQGKGLRSNTITTTMYYIHFE